MKKIIFAVAMTLTSVSAFAGGDFTKEVLGCYKVTQIRFDGDSVQISGVNVVTGKRGISYFTSSGEGNNKEEFKQNVETAKFAMAYDLQICVIDGSRLLSLRK